MARLVHRGHAEGVFVRAGRAARGGARQPTAPDLFRGVISPGPAGTLTNGRPVFIVPAPSPAVSRDRPASCRLLLQGARLADGRVADMMVAGGMIVSVGGHHADHPSPAEVVDLCGYLLLPSLVEPHAHLTLPSAGRMGVQRTDGGGWVAAGSELAPTDIVARIRTGAARYLMNGTTAIRVHVDVGKKAGTWAVEALLNARSSLAGILDMQIVAAVSAPVSGLAGATNRALLRHALAAGADLAGAGPGLVDETGRTVESLAVLAADAGAGLDVHIDETIGSVMAALPRLIAIAEAGFDYPVTVSHLASLGTKTKQRRHATQSLADAGIGVVMFPRSGPFQHRGGDAGAPPAR